MTPPGRSRRARHTPPPVTIVPDSYLHALVADAADFETHRKRLGCTHETLAAASWCMAFHEELSRIAEERNIDLILMGGQAAALRMESAEQRGSQDNDYLTTMDESVAAQCIDELQARYSGVRPKNRPIIFRPKKPGRGARRLPMRTWSATLPSPRGADVEVKLEFHFTRDPPPTEKVSRAHFGLTYENAKARIPLAPFQVSLKLLTLTMQPIGLAPAREGAAPRQCYDIDALLVALNGDQLRSLESAFKNRLREECRRMGLRERSTRAVLRGIEIRVQRWVGELHTEASSMSHHVSRLQNSELFPGTRRSMPEWQSRYRRVLVAAHLLRTGSLESDWPALMSTEKVLERGLARDTFWAETAADLTGL